MKDFIKFLLRGCGNHWKIFLPAGRLPTQTCYLHQITGRSAKSIMFKRTSTIGTWYIRLKNSQKVIAKSLDTQTR